MGATMTCSKKNPDMPLSGDRPPHNMKEHADLLFSKRRRPLVWALVPYCVERDALVAETWDDEVTKSELADSFHALRVPWVWQPIVATNLRNVVQQISRLAACRDSIVFNFCDGTDGDDAPGISVVQALEAAGTVFTGADSRFYAISISKIAMKELFVHTGVPTPAFELPPPNRTRERDLGTAGIAPHCQAGDLLGQLRHRPEIGGRHR